MKTRFPPWGRLELVDPRDKAFTPDFANRGACVAARFILTVVRDLRDHLPPTTFLLWPGVCERFFLVNFKTRKLINHHRTYNKHRWGVIGKSALVERWWGGRDRPTDPYIDS